MTPTTVADVAAFLERLSSLFADEAKEMKGKEKHYTQGQASGIEFAITALANVK